MAGTCLENQDKIEIMTNSSDAAHSDGYNWLQEKGSTKSSEEEIECGH